MLVLLFFILNNGICILKFELLKVFNDATNILPDIYYPTTNLFIIKSLNIVGAFDDCMSQKPNLVSFIQVMKSKWLNYIKTFQLFIC